jgi:hypothetical protein
MFAQVLLAALLQLATPPAADEQLVAAARSASAAFQDRNAAIRAGYRRLGPEVPEMGEHWINPIMIVESRYQPARPAVLTYATFNGRPTLTGVAYALAMRAGETAPPTGVSGTWHDHAATVFAELANADHGARAEGARVVVMHAWVWVDNPAGVFADENWALPYLRLGRMVPAQIDPHAARALALLHDGGAYYAGVLRNLTGEDFSAELREAAKRVPRTAEADLAAIWRDTARALTAQVNDPVLKARVLVALGVTAHSHEAPQ